MIYYFIALVFIFGKHDRPHGLFYDDVQLYDNVDFDEVYEVDIENDTLTVPYGQIVLELGKMYLVGYVDDRPISAYYQGDGVIKYYPKNDIEAQQIKRFYRTDTVDEKFNEIYFAFPEDSKFLERYYDAGDTVNIEGRVKNMYGGLKKVPSSDFKYDLPVNLCRASIEEKNDFLWINARRERYSNTIYFYDPYSYEQIQLYKYASNFKTPQLVSSVTDPKVEHTPVDTRLIDLFDYDMNINIPAIVKSDIACTMTFTVMAENLRVVPLNFPAKFDVDSVAGVVADSLEFIKDDGRRGVYVRLDNYYHKGDIASVTVYYRAGLFRQYIQYGIVQDYLTRWYPYNGFRQLSTYHLWYTIDPGTTFLSVGKMAKDTIIEGKRHLEFASEKPLAYAGFNYGVFDSTEVPDAPIPITVYSLKKDNSLLFGKGGINNVVKDVGDAYGYFESFLGPGPTDRLEVDPMNMDFGQSSAGLVHLAENTFDSNVPGIHDKYRAHEIAHQWFGHVVQPLTYHDVWISEGISEYLGALYVRNVKKDDKAFTFILKEWKKQVTKKGNVHGLRSIGYRAGAIWLGYRLMADPSPGDYETLVYYKAAFMMYRLHRALTDASGDDSKFFELLSRFVRENRGKLVSTDDFINYTRPYLGDKTDDFFKHWLYDWKISEDDFDLDK